MAVEALSLVLGGCFVVAQAMIGRTATMLMQVGVPIVAPRARAMLLELESPRVEGVGVIPAIDALANYFKHHDEWPADWSEAKGRARATIAIVGTLGLSASGPDNMLIGARALRLEWRNDPTALAGYVRRWRTAIAGRILGRAPESA
jgi:hypothetical protein